MTADNPSESAGELSLSESRVLADTLAGLVEPIRFGYLNCLGSAFLEATDSFDDEVHGPYF